MFEFNIRRECEDHCAQERQTLRMPMAFFLTLESRFFRIEKSEIVAHI